LTTLQLLDAAAFDFDGFTLALARVSGFLLLLPGFSSLRVPVRVRAMIAAALAFAMAPVIPQPVPKADAMMIATEVAAGLVLGALVRLHFLALAFAGATMSAYVGLAPTPGLPVDSDETQQALQTLLSLTATALTFASGLHLVLLRGLGDSYALFPPGTTPDPSLALHSALATLDEAFLVTLQLAMPFLAYGVIVNFAIGLANRLAPQVPLQLIAMPFVIFGGMMLFHALAPDAVAVFHANFANWLQNRWF
jgi:flagellar biosynthesis protein FliR